MCFFISRQRVAKIATKDIPCYKVLYMMSDGRLQSPFQTTFWKFDKVVKCRGNILRIAGKKTVITTGIHSFIEYEKAKERSFGWNNKVYSAVIPKGSLYWINKNTGEYVSESLLIKRLIKTRLSKI